MEKVSIWLLCLALTVNLSQQSKITLDNIFNRDYSASGFSGTWVSDTELDYIESGNTIRYDIISNTTQQVIDGTLFQNYSGRSLSVSSDGSFILITHLRKSVWRSSSLAKYTLYDQTKKTFENLVPPGYSVNSPPDLQLVRWSPVSNALVFVFKNNIYYRSSALEGTSSVNITSDGTHLISNGHTDWVYEEEMFGSGNALWFSPNGNYLAFVKFDDTNVTDFQYPIYGEPGVRETTYPNWTHIPYPKSGHTNPIAKMYLVDLNTPSNPYEISYPSNIPAGQLHYIATVSWRTSVDLIVVHLNRRQQHSTWFNCNPVVGQNCVMIWNETETEGWIDVNSPKYSKDGSSILTLSSAKTIGGGPTSKSYRHIVKINTTSTSHINTRNFHIDSILGWDEDNNKIYFSGNVEGNPSETQIYYVADNAGSIENPQVKCITCDLENTNNEKCRSNSISLSQKFTYFLHSCSGPGIPETSFRITSNSTNIKRVWVDNAILREKLKTVEVPITKEYFNISLESGHIARARLYLPLNFDENKKYPLLIDVYGGPDSQKLNYGFGINWGSSLVSNKNIIYGYIDGRGSGRQTREHLYLLNNKLGTFEIQDQIATTKWLIENTNYIDPNRTAIWGWSYGGYATAMVMSQDIGGIFKCGISVAPVTSWLYYDTIYTERYMGLPTDDDNLANYISSDVNTHIDNFRNKTFLLVHGNADDNVHYQQSMILSRALEKADILFSQISYPDEAHSISGTNHHLYHSLEKFLFKECFSEVKENEPGNPSSTMTPPDMTVPPSDGYNLNPTSWLGLLSLYIFVQYL